MENLSGPLSFESPHIPKPPKPPASKANTPSTMQGRNIKKEDDKTEGSQLSKTLTPEESLTPKERMKKGAAKNYRGKPMPKQEREAGGLTDKIARQAQLMQLQKTAKGMQHAAKLEGEQGHYRMRNVAGSQNPVTKVQPEFFVPVDSLKDEKASAFSRGGKVLSEAERKEQGLNAVKEACQKALQEHQPLIKRMHAEKKQLIEQKYKKLMEQPRSLYVLEKKNGLLQGKQQSENAAKAHYESQVERSNAYCDQRLAKIAANQQKLVQKETELVKLKEKLSELKEKLKQLPDDKSLQEQIEELSENVKDLSEGIESMRPEKQIAKIEKQRSSMKEEHQQEYTQTSDRIEQDYAQRIAELDSPTFDPKTELQAKKKAELDALEKDTEKDKLDARQHITNFYQKIITSKLSNNPREILQFAIEDLDESSILEADSPTQKLNVALKSNLQDLNATIDLTHVPKRYPKEQVLTNLRNMMRQDTSEERNAQILSSIEAIRALPDSYIKEDDLKGKSIPFKELVLNIPAFVSSQEVMAQHGYVSGVMKKMESAVSREPGFAFKLGIENQRELLAGHINRLALGNPFLLAKTQVQFEQTALGDLKNPTGIASEWLEGQDLDSKLWKSYMNLERDIQKGQFRGEDVSAKIKELEAKKLEILAIDGGARAQALSKYKECHAKIAEFEKKIADLDEKIKKFKGPNEQLENLKMQKEELSQRAHQQKPILLKRADNAMRDLRSLIQTPLHSVLLLAITDLDLLGYDSHIDQIKFAQGEAYDFDFARFLSPKTAYADASGTYVAFRSGLMDHPHCAETIPADIVASLRSRDMNAIEAKLKENNLLGTADEYKEAQKKLAKNDTNLGKAKAGSPETLRSLAIEYQLDPNAVDLDKQLLSAISKEEEAIKTACFNKIHPEAFQAWKERNERMQNYLATEKNPTVLGMRDAVFPELAVFFKVLGRYEAAPSDTIGIGVINDMTQRRSLDSIIIKAETENLATAKTDPNEDSELKQMKDTLYGTLKGFQIISDLMSAKGVAVTPEEVDKLAKAHSGPPSRSVYMAQKLQTLGSEQKISNLLSSHEVAVTPQQISELAKGFIAPKTLEQQISEIDDPKLRAALKDLIPNLQKCKVSVNPSEVVQTLGIRDKACESTDISLTMNL